MNSNGSPAPIPCMRSAKARLARMLAPSPTIRPTDRTRPVAIKHELQNVARMGAEGHAYAEFPSPMFH